jgi:hypothetical protein
MRDEPRHSTGFPNVALPLLNPVLKVQICVFLGGLFEPFLSPFVPPHWLVKLDRQHSNAPSGLSAAGLIIFGIAAVQRRRVQPRFRRDRGSRSHSNL